MTNFLNRFKRPAQTSPPPPAAPPPPPAPPVDADWQITGTDNVVSRPPSASIDRVSLRITGDHNRVTIGDGVILSNTRIVIAGHHHSVRFGNRVQLRNSTIWIEDSDCVLTLGDDTTAEGVGLALTEPGSKITVGRDCMFSYGIDVRTGDSHSILDLATGRRINFAADVTLGDRVWVGAHSMILKGVTLANDTVVATSAVVVRPETRPNVILAGNPAKVVKEGITWHRARLPKDA